MSNIVLLGQSHAVSLLDAICDWRSALRLNAASPAEADYSPAFRGWLSVNTQGQMIQPVMHPRYAAFSRMRVCLLSAAAFSGVLANVTAVEGGQVRLSATDTLMGFIRAVGDADTIISVISGNHHAKLALVGSYPAYDFAPYTAPPEGQPVDRIHINDLLAQLGSMVAAPLACLRSAFPRARILHVTPPPPLLDPSKATVHEALREEIRQHGFTAPGLRRKWHEAYIEQLKAQLAPLRVEVVGADPVATSSEGFLAPELAEGLTHGNAAYGEHLAAALLARLQAGLQPGTRAP
ncbi:MAG: hypothetical protein JNK75_07295 [Betaproteobacteria bacterium]|nr:hypothetical protein [Betaproteobacteria bacterium]